MLTQPYCVYYTLWRKPCLHSHTVYIIHYGGNHAYTAILCVLPGQGLVLQFMVFGSPLWTKAGQSTPPFVACRMISGNWRFIPPPQVTLQSPNSSYSHSQSSADKYTHYLACMENNIEPVHLPGHGPASHGSMLGTLSITLSGHGAPPCFGCIVMTGN